MFRSVSAIPSAHSLAASVPWKVSIAVLIPSFIMPVGMSATPSKKASVHSATKGCSFITPSPSRFRFMGVFLLSPLSLYTLSVMALRASGLFLTFSGRESRISFPTPSILEAKASPAYFFLRDSICLFNSSVVDVTSFIGVFPKKSVFS